MRPSRLKKFLEYMGITKKDIVICRYEMILLFSVLLLSGAVMPSDWETPVQSFPIPSALTLPRHPWIALTFDDGPHPGMTDRLLSVLQKEHVPATFFVVGKMAERYPELLRKIISDGDEIENHTYSHQDMARLSPDAVLEELNRTRDIIRRATGVDSVFYRPPGGDYNRRSIRMAAKAGYHMVLWSVLTDDVEGAPPRAIRERILERAEDGGIVLMHSGVEGTIEALPRIIAELRHRGYSFVTVSTMLGTRREPFLETVSARRAPAVIQVQ